MKSRTSFFNKTAFSKDLTRFAPAWGVYTVLMLMMLISMSDRSMAYYRLQNVRDSVVAMSWVNLVYAAIVAQLVFGDLFNSRMCNALHALPLRRENWFCTHVAAGIAYSFLPNLVLALVALPVMRLEAGWSAVFWWLLAAELQYLFFFGVAVLCMLLSGNRLGQFALYGMIQFGGLIGYWLVSSVYEPFLHGIQFTDEPFLTICPLAKIATSDLLIIDCEKISNAFGDVTAFKIYGVAPGEGWGYLAICALVGIAALAAALMLYRRRKLECAGDFVAFPAIEPVVTVIVTVFVGVVFHLFADVFAMNLRSVMLGGGMVIGFFGCRMLLERTVRVFRKKAFVFCGCILAIFGLSVLLTYLDPAGVTRYIPDADDVESITFSQSYSLSSHSEFPFTATQPEDIAALQRVHALGITKESSSQLGGTEEVYNGFNIRLEYKLKNGRTINRFYDIYPKSEAGVILKDYFTTTDCVLGIPAEKVPTIAPHIRSIFVAGWEEVQYDLDELDIPGMLDAIAADCAAGNMAQVDGYHYPVNYDLLGYGYEDIDGIIAYLEIGWDREWIRSGIQAHPDAGVDPMPMLRYKTIEVYRSCENTIRWMEENGLLDEERLQYSGKYG